MTFSTKWKSSKVPRKQRKYQYNAPLHLRRKFMSVHLSSELRKKHGRRAIPVRQGDNVKIVRGQFKGKKGKVERMDHKDLKVYITGQEQAKIDGSKSLIPFTPSNLIIETLNMDDKRRMKTQSSVKEAEKQHGQATPKKA